MQSLLPPVVEVMPMASDSRETIASYAMSREEVTPKRMFGADCFLVNGRMFAFILKDSLAVKAVPSKRQEFLAYGQARPLTMPNSGRAFGEWLELPISSADQIAVALAAIASSYEYILSQPTKREHRRRTE